MRRIKQKSKTEFLGRSDSLGKARAGFQKWKHLPSRLAWLQVKDTGEKWVAEHRQAALLGRAMVTAVTLKGVLCADSPLVFFNVKYFHPHFKDEEKQWQVTEGTTQTK